MLDRIALNLISCGYVFVKESFGKYYGYPQDLRWFAHGEPIYALPLLDFPQIEDEENYVMPEEGITDPYWVRKDGEDSYSYTSWRVYESSIPVLSEENNPIYAVRRELMPLESQFIAEVWQRDVQG